MPIKYIPYHPEPVEGQAVLDNFVRTQRVLRYRDHTEVHQRILRGIPYYEVEEVEHIGDAPDANLVIRGECLSACAYLKEQGIKVDLVYIDPPFASGADYAKKVHVRRNPKVAEAIAAAEQQVDADDMRAFDEKMYGDIWQKEAYLNWMYENLMAIREILADHAAIYVHLDPKIGHYVKVLMDEVFGEDNFRNEIIWCYKTSLRASESAFGRDHDTIFFYAKGEEHLIHPDKTDFPSSESTIKRWGPYADESGFVSNKHFAGSSSTIIDTTDESKGFNIYSGIPRDWWEISANVSKGNTDEVSAGKYATQKPEALLERILKASSDEWRDKEQTERMVVADFFGGSGVTAKVAHSLGRRFIHVDVGVNSIQTVRDRLKEAGASFRIMEVKDGVSLFRNPQQTMDRLGKLVKGLQRKVAGLGDFWYGAVNDSREGTVPVYMPNLIDSHAKVLDIPTVNRILNEELQKLDFSPQRVIVFYVDVDDRAELEKFIRDTNPTQAVIELRDLKSLLHEVVLEDIVEYACTKDKTGHLITMQRLISDRVMQKIDAFNQKGNMQSVKNGKAFAPITISDDGLELIELVSADCEHSEGPWHSSHEVKVDKLGHITVDGAKSKEFWDGTLRCAKKPLRIKVRNICGDETVVQVE